MVRFGRENSISHKIRTALSVAIAEPLVERDRVAIYRGELPETKRRLAYTGSTFSVAIGILLISRLLPVDKACEARKRRNRLELARIKLDECSSMWGSDD